MAGTVRFGRPWFGPVGLGQDGQDKNMAWQGRQGMVSSVQAPHVEAWRGKVRYREYNNSKNDKGEINGFQIRMERL